MVSLDQLVEDAKRDFSKASDPAGLEDAKARYLGKSGLLTERLKALGGMSPEERKSAGALINQAKSAVEDALNARRQAMANQVLQARLAAEAIDVSLPGRGQAAGSLHHFFIATLLDKIEIYFSGTHNQTLNLLGIQCLVLLRYHCLELTFGELR